MTLVTLEEIRAAAHRLSGIALKDDTRMLGA